MRLRFMLLCLVALPAFAHPPVSVVIDARGNAFYSDLDQVWKVAPDGTKSVAVRNVHTHELYLDARGNLYGEHLWYEGDATKKWGHYVWRHSPDGKTVAITNRREGFLHDLSFVRDAAGNMYRSDEAQRNVLKRTPGGVVTTVARRLTALRWMAVSPAGTIYAVDGRDVVRIWGGRVEKILRGAEQPMGLWLDRAENVYLADFGAGVVKRITPSGAVTTFAKSPLLWKPSGGAFAANGDLLLLEVTMINQVRLRRIVK